LADRNRPAGIKKIGGTGYQPPVAPRLPAQLAPADDAVLGADAHWEGLRVGADLSGQIAEDPIISGCRVSGAAFVGAELIRARVNDTLFERCDMSGVILAHAVLTRVEFHDCRLSGADLSAGHWRDVCFRETRLVDATFRMSSGERVRFEGCDASRADFYATQLPLACLFNSNFNEAQMSKATLEGARLHGSTFEGINGAEALRGSTISSEQVMPLAFQLLANWGITVDDDPDPGREPA
jgi:uncharacterized protein YjbI with pentapeptide repeats